MMPGQFQPGLGSSSGFHNLMKATSIIPIMVLLILLMRPDNDASAFHDGGVGACDACHSMHNATQPSQLASSGSLLRSSDPSSTCLNCHEAADTGPTSYHVSTADGDMPQGSPPRQLGPAGDFGWLKKTFEWRSATGVLQRSPGERHGHNIIANNFQYFADSTNTEAPMGNYPATSLTCISCHDPHGKYRRDATGSIATSGTAIQGSGSYASSAGPQSGFSVGVYRLLGGKDYQPKYLSGSFGFLNNPPAAVAPDTYNRAESGTQTRVAYGSNMSEWCQNCHNTPKEHAIVSSGTSTTVPHPVGSLAKFGSTLSTNYNMYVKTGVLTGNVTKSFLSLVPFEEGTSDYSTLKAHARSDDSYLYGPDSASSQVMCLTCHRAHASAWDYSTRWNANSDYIVYNGFYSQYGQASEPYGQGRTEMEAQKAYYDMRASRFALNQDTLCHKCHVGALP
jgi:Doubled CXXCH motif (Paired_CXXCH_1)